MNLTDMLSSLRIESKFRDRCHESASYERNHSSLFAGSLPGHHLCTLRYLLIPVATIHAVDLHRDTQDFTSRDKVLSAALRKILYGILHCVVGWIVANSGNILADSTLPQRATLFKMSVILRAPLGSVCVYMEDSNVLLRSYRIITTTYCSVRMCVSCISLSHKKVKNCVWYMICVCVWSYYFFFFVWWAVFLTE